MESSTYKVKSPILFLLFNRPSQTNIVFEQIRRARPSKLYLCADGPRLNNNPDQIKCIDVRKIVKKIDWDCECKTLFRDKNLGCKLSVANGIDWFFEQEEEGIILEDDILPNESFFRFGDEMLDLYRDNFKISSICGFNPIGNKIFIDNNSSYLFSNYNDIWGWATWKRSWKFYDKDLKSWPLNKNKIKEIEKNRFQYWYDVFQNVYLGKINTWDHQWTYTGILNRTYCIIPNVNLVQNIGFDSDATHTKIKDGLLSKIMRNELKFPLNHPNQIINNKIYDNFLFHNIVINKKLIKQFIYKFKNIIANVFYKLFYKIHLYNKKNEIVKWEGKYENWQDAMKYSNSYSNIQILEKCKTSLLRVKNGDAVYERDSIIFNEIQYSWPVTAILIKVGFENNSNLCILDYGGSLGSSFFQNKNFLSNISNLNWCIIEQEHFVECGIENFQNDNLSFYYDLDSFFDKNIPNIVLFSSVLQYLEKPYELLTKIIEEKVKYIIFDLTTFIDSNEDVITIQTVKPPIYDATYPCWFFNKEQLITFFLINGYSVEYQWMANYQINFGYHAGLAFKLNN